MTGTYTIVAAVFCLLVIIKEGLALDCIQCNSFEKPGCDATPSDYSAPCANENATSCRKMEQEIFYDGDYQTRTIRQCAIESGPMKCIERTGTYRFKVWYCHCEGDNCNASNSLVASLGLALVLAAVGAVFKL